MSQLLTLTDDTFSAFLRCKYKAYLKLMGATGQPSDYVRLLHQLAAKYRADARAQWLGNRLSDGLIERPASLPDAIASGAPSIVDAVATDGAESCLLDGLKCDKQVTVYSPILFVRGERLSTNDRLLLAYGANILGRLQGIPPKMGTIIHGSDFRTAKIQLGPLLEPARRIVEETRPLRQGTAVPPLVLNKHCQECEFQRRCRATAVEKDDLSLLAGLSPKEIAAQNRKGMFTVTQFSYTFRPGRMRRVVQAGGRRHDVALQALALRENSVYITARQPLVDPKIKVFLDVEGLTDPNRYYLIGLLIVAEDSSQRLSFWADRMEDEATIWASFLKTIKDVGEEFVLYHYGSYDARFIQRMTKAHGGDPEVLGGSRGHCKPLVRCCTAAAPPDPCRQRRVRQGTRRVPGRSESRADDFSHSAEYQRRPCRLRSHGSQPSEGRSADGGVRPEGRARPSSDRPKYAHPHAPWAWLRAWRWRPRETTSQALS